MKDAPFVRDETLDAYMRRHGADVAADRRETGVTPGGQLHGQRSAAGKAQEAGKR